LLTLPTEEYEDKLIGAKLLHIKKGYVHKYDIKEFKKMLKSLGCKIDIESIRKDPNSKTNIIARLNEKEDKSSIEKYFDSMKKLGGNEKKDKSSDAISISNVKNPCAPSKSLGPGQSCLTGPTVENGPSAEEENKNGRGNSP
jgi:arsenate reductase-like glutaredoxin family protein